MAERAFDRKFGPEHLQTVPTTPGVYLFRDEAARVIYVGKAKNLRRRLSSYRLASRRRAHRKMRILVREASALEVRPCESEQAALLTEDALIKQLRPAYNVDGAYAFLYPAIGLAGDRRRLLLALSTDPEQWTGLSLHWYGVFRSRPRAKAGFEALHGLLTRLGHREPRSRLPAHPAVRGARLVAVRQLPQPVLDALPGFLAGRDDHLPRVLSQALLLRPRARQQAGDVQLQLHALQALFDRDCARLRATLERLGDPRDFVTQDERDALFIRARA